MGENENKLDSGQLYFIEPDGSTSLLGNVTDIECTTEENDISEVVAKITGCESSFEMLAKTTKEILLAITGIYQAVIDCCPDKRVVHLALHGKTARIRKKNRNRAFIILEEN